MLPSLAGRVCVCKCVCVRAIHRVNACVCGCRRGRKTAAKRRRRRREKGCVCVCVREADRCCVCMHETKLHGCVACVTKSLSWMTYKGVNVHAVRELIQRSVRTHWWKIAQLLPQKATLCKFNAGRWEITQQNERGVNSGIETGGFCELDWHLLCVWIINSGIAHFPHKKEQSWAFSNAVFGCKASLWPCFCASSVQLKLLILNESNLYLLTPWKCCYSMHYTPLI